MKLFPFNYYFASLYIMFAMCPWLFQLSGTPCILSYCDQNNVFFSFEFENKYDLIDLNFCVKMLQTNL